MVKKLSSPPKAEDFARYLATRDDFALELRVFSMLKVEVPDFCRQN